MPRTFAAELFAIALFNISFHNLFAQTAATVPHKDTVTSRAKATLTVRDINLTHTMPLLGMPQSTVMGYPPRCSSDGTIFLEVYSDASSPEVAYIPKIFRISDQREVKKIDIPLPSGYKVFTLMSFYAGANGLIYLMQASQPKTPDQQSESEKVFFLTTTDRDGDHQKIIKMDSKIEPVKAALFDSDEVLLLGIDTSNLQPALAMLHEDGSLDKRLDLDARTYDSSEELHKINPNSSRDSNTFVKQQFILSSLNTAQFIPWGKEILLLQPGSKLPIYRFRNSGQMDAVTITAPEGFALASILSSGEKDTWVVRARDIASFEKITHGSVVENAPEQLFEINPETGKIIDQLSVQGPQPGEISCAANGKLSAVYYGGPPRQDNASDQLTYASAPR